MIAATHDPCRLLHIAPGPITAAGGRSDASGRQTGIFRRMHCVSGLVASSPADRDPDPVPRSMPFGMQSAAEPVASDLAQYY